MICTSCYRDLPAGAAYCPRCGARVAPGPGVCEPVVAAAAVAGTAGTWRNPWEQRGGRGWFAAFAETLQESLFRPSAFFRGTAPEGGTGAALWYAVIVGTLSLAVALLWRQALGGRIPMEHGGRFLRLLDDRATLTGLSVFLPFGIALGNVVWAAALHVSLAVVGGARGGYGTTLKAVCYSSSATAFNVFPVCGAALGAIWQVVVQVIGLRELHRTSTARAFWAWVLPFVVALCLGAAAALAAVFGLMRIWHQLGGQFEV
ncbi:MAG TPA: YIP1 family protein [bacterium]